MKKSETTHLKSEITLNSDLTNSICVSVLDLSFINTTLGGFDWLVPVWWNSRLIDQCKDNQANHKVPRN